MIFSLVLSLFINRLKTLIAKHYFPQKGGSFFVCGVNFTQKTPLPTVNGRGVRGKYMILCKPIFSTFQGDLK